MRTADEPDMRSAAAKDKLDAICRCRSAIP